MCWWGIAGAVKLVPLVYIGYYVITGRWKAVAGGLAGFLGATALGFAVLPRQTIDYFGDIASLSGGRVAVGDPSVFGNQSVRGMALRLLPEGLVGPAWLVACAVLGVLGIVATRRAQRLRGGDLAGFTVVALLAAIVTPIAWTHHFVWLVPAVGVLLVPIKSGVGGGHSIGPCVVLDRDRSHRCRSAVSASSSRRGHGYPGSRLRAGEFIALGEPRGSARSGRPPA